MTEQPWPRRFVTSWKCKTAWFLHGSTVKLWFTRRRSWCFKRCVTPPPPKVSPLLSLFILFSCAPLPQAHLVCFFHCWCPWQGFLVQCSTSSGNEVACSSVLHLSYSPSFRSDNRLTQSRSISLRSSPPFLTPFHGPDPRGHCLLPSPLWPPLFLLLRRVKAGPVFWNENCRSGGPPTPLPPHLPMVC